MSDFYQHIKDTLSKPPTHPPDDVVWAAVASGVVSKKNWLPFPLWYLLPMGLVLLLVGAGGYYWGNKQAQAQIPVVQVPEPTTDHSADERFIPPEITHDTLLIRDTIVQFVYLPAKSSSKSIDTEFPSFSFPSNADSVLFFINGQLYLKTDSGIALIPEDGSSDEFNTGAKPEAEQAITLPALAKIQFKEPIHDMFPSRIPRYPRPFIPGYGQLNRLREAFRVDEKQLGLGFQGLNFPFASNFSEGTEWSVGMEAQLVFTEKFSFLSGLQYRFDEVKSEDPAYVATFPQPSNVNPEDDFKEMYLRSSFLEIPFLAKFSFPNRSSFSPFVMGGPMVSKAVRQGLEFEYEDINNEEYKLPVPLEPGAIHLSSWIISGGVAYKIKPDSPFSLLAEARFRYNSNISAAEYTKIHGLGLRVGGVWTW